MPGYKEKPPTFKKCEGLIVGYNRLYATRTPCACHIFNYTIFCAVVNLFDLQNDLVFLRVELHHQRQALVLVLFHVP